MIAIPGNAVIGIGCPLSALPEYRQVFPMNETAVGNCR